MLRASCLRGPSRSLGRPPVEAECWSCRAFGGPSRHLSGCTCAWAVHMSLPATGPPSPDRMGGHLQGVMWFLTAPSTGEVLVPPSLRQPLAVPAIAPLTAWATQAPRMGRSPQSFEQWPLPFSPEGPAAAAGLLSCHSPLVAAGQVGLLFWGRLPRGPSRGQLPRLSGPVLRP